MTAEGERLPRAAAVATFAAAAALAAAAAPLATYAGSLALFGAPHALAELRYVDGRFGRRLGAPRAVLIAAALATVVLLRGLALAGAVATSDALVLELAVVAALAFVAVPALRARPLGAAVAVAVGALFAAGSWVAPAGLAVLLAVLHNATPVAFLAERPALRRRIAIPAVLLFVVVPALLATGLPSELLGAAGLAAPDAAFASAGRLSDHLRVFVPAPLLGSAAAPAIFAACAYLQVLHHASVLVVLPRLAAVDAAEGRRPLLRWPRAAVLATAIAIVGAGFAVAFLLSFVPTRAAYGLLAAVHAWIEVPVLLLALAPAGEAAARAVLPRAAA